MLILIFTSKLPREGGELFSLKKTSPSLCQSPLMGNTCRRYGSLQGALRSCCPGRGSACPGRGSPVLGKALPVLGEVLLPWERFFCPGRGSACWHPAPLPPLPPITVLRGALLPPPVLPTNLLQGGKADSLLTLGNLRGAGISQHFVALLVFGTLFCFAEFILFHCVFASVKIHPREQQQCEPTKKTFGKSLPKAFLFINFNDCCSRAELWDAEDIWHPGPSLQLF